MKKKGSLAAPLPMPYQMVNFNARYNKPEQAIFIREKLRPFVDHGVHPKGMFFLMTRRHSPLLF